MKNKLFAITILIAAFGSATSLTAQKLPSLFELVSEPEVSSSPSSIASIRESKVRINTDVWGPSVKIPLFDGKTYEAVETGSEMRALDDRTWRGKIFYGPFEGDVVLTFRKGFVSGIIFSPDQVYEIVPRGKEHYLVEIEQAKFPECAGEVTDKSQRSVTAAREGVDADSGDRIDVLVLYTAAVRTSLGGDAQAQTVAQQAIDSTNTAYINSRIRQRVRLVGAELTAMNETGSFSTELSNLRANAAAATSRNTLNADMVAMLTNSTAACGIGYLMGAQGGNPNNAFTVTARTCAVGNLSFAHELGHNMGSQHNPENGSGPTFPYGFGHYVNGVYRTVMSYVDPCTSGCTRRAYFSNPNVVFMGFPTGIPSARDNARSINNTADVIANYRYSGSSITLNSLNSGEGVTHDVLMSINWTSNGVASDVRIEMSRDEGTTWEVLVSNTPNDGTEMLAIPRPSNRRSRLRITSVATPSITDSSVMNFRVR